MNYDIPAHLRPPSPPFVHQVYDAIVSNGTQAGFVRTQLRQLSPNDLYCLKMLCPPLVHAVSSSGSAAVLLLMKYEFDFDWSQTYGDVGSALHAAGAAGNAETVELLLSYCEDNVVDIHDRTQSSGKTALHVAAEEGHADIVASLLNAGADAGAPDRSGNTALHLACRRQQFSACTRLVNCGARLDVININAEAPWMAAANLCDIDLLRLVYTKAAPTYAQPAQFVTTSQVLSDLQTLETLKALVELGERVDTLTATGADLIHLAVARRKDMTASYLKQFMKPAYVPIPFL